jgi:hypothetical protein
MNISSAALDADTALLHQMIDDNNVAAGLDQQQQQDQQREIQRQRRTLFFVQLLLSLLVVGFCIVRLAIRIDDCATEAVFLPILTAVLGFWLPPPRP